MDQIASLQQDTIESILGEKVQAHWQDILEVEPLLEQFPCIEDSQQASMQYLMRLILSICESEGEQARFVLLCLEAFCAASEPAVVAQTVARFLLFSGEEYPKMPYSDEPAGWLEWSLDYKQELEKRGSLARKLWSLVKGHGPETEQ